MQFIKATGRRPELDDLERANCQRRGIVGHFGCGVCEHGKPVFECFPCFRRSGNEPIAYHATLGHISISGPLGEVG